MPPIRNRHLLALVWGAMAMSATAAQAADTPATRPTDGWWSDARFGLFIHWGLYAVPAGKWTGRDADTHYSGGLGEWLMHDAKVPAADYAKLAGQFNPTAFDADAWADLAAAAGMRYVVITAKHHDGFAMFRTAVDDFNIVTGTPFKRDPVAELAAACRKRGLKFGLYYSQAQDWHHPGGAAAGGHWDKAQDGDFDHYLRTVAEPQVRELVAQYQPAIVWWDTPFQMNAARAERLAALLPPGTISNDRLGGDVRADYATPEQRIPANGYGGRPWETCMTINDTWGYKANDHHFKSATALARDLIDIVSKGGNFLLNVGPDATGTIPPAEADRLRQIGDWLKVNGQAVYGTTAGPFARTPAWGRITRRGNTLYLLVYDRDPKGVVRIKLPVRNTRGRAYLLSAPADPIPMGVDKDGLAVFLLNKQMTDPIATVVAVDLADPPDLLPPLAVAAGPGGVVTLRPADATLAGDAIQVETHDGQDNIGYWTRPADRAHWSARLAAGVYDVELTYSCQQPDGSQVRVAVGAAATPTRLPSTGGYDRYRTTVVGRADQAKPGEVSVGLTPELHRWAPINVRQLRLVPHVDATEPVR